MDNEEKFERRVVKAIDRFDGKLDLETMELKLQQISTELREQREVPDEVQEQA